MPPTSIAQRAAQIAVELRQLQAELLAQKEACPKKLVEDQGTLELIRELKSAVDAMRLLLWKYIDLQAAEKASFANSQRLAAATAALQSLRGDTLPGQPSASFIESVSEVVDRYAKRPDQAA